MFVYDRFDLTGKTAIVTGATKGLGYGMSMALAQAGADIVVVSRTASDCEKVAAEIEGMGRKALALPADMTKFDTLGGLVDTVVEKMGKVDILVNNAGVGITKPALDITEDEWDKVVDLNLKGVFFLAQAVGRQMKKQNSGKIINISSAYGVVADANVTPYISSKAAVIMMTKALAVEWARYNIQVNSVCPGYVITSMNEKEFSDPKVRDHFVKKIPQRRLGEIEDLGGVVVYLASKASDYVTGSNIIVDGGITL